MRNLFRYKFVFIKLCVLYVYSVKLTRDIKKPFHAHNYFFILLRKLRVKPRITKIIKK